MPNYKLTYFDIKGRAEPVRIMFHLADVKFDDERLSYEQWPERKPKTPFGQLPILEIDGRIYAQSVAIMNYVARTYGFYGKTPLDNLAVDQVVALVSEIGDAFVKATHDEDEAVKAKNVQEFMSTTVPRFMGFFEKLISDNEASFFVGSSITLADIYGYCMLSELFALDATLGDKYPLCKKLVEAVETTPRIKAYLEASKKN